MAAARAWRARSFWRRSVPCGCGPSPWFPPVRGGSGFCRRRPVGSWLRGLPLTRARARPYFLFISRRPRRQLATHPPRFGSFPLSPQRGRLLELLHRLEIRRRSRGKKERRLRERRPEAVARRTVRWPLAAVAFVRPAVPDPSVALVARPVAARRRRCPCSWHALFRVKQGRSAAEPAQICRALPDRRQPCSCFRVSGQSSLARAPCHRFASVRGRPLLLPLPPFRPWPCPPLPFSAVVAPARAGRCCRARAFANDSSRPAVPRLWREGPRSGVA